MKKILVGMFFLVICLCLAGCETIIEYASLSSITKDEEFTSAYISSVNGDSQVLPVDFDDLKEKEFYKNIMNSSAKPTDVLPEVVPMWSLVIKSDNNQLVIDNLGNLYAEFNDKRYHILCSENDYVALDKYLIPSDSNLTIADLIDSLAFDEVTLKKGDLSLGLTKNFDELKNQLFYNDLMKVTVYSSEATLEKMTMVDVDYYLNFYIKDSEDFFSIRIYGVYNINDDYVICLTKSNVMNDLYEFTMSSELFNQIYDYFSVASKIEVAKFTEIEDIELLSFYNETMVINSVDGFPFIVTTDDLQTSQQLARVHERYNEEFFEHYALMIIAFDTCSTEEIIGINDIKFDGEKFIAVFDVSGVPITDDISTRHFVFKINKLAFENMDKPSYQVDIKVNNLDNIGSGSAYYDEYFTPIEDVVDKTYLYEYDGFGGEFTIDIYNDGTFMYYVGFFSSYIGRGNWEYTNGILTLTDVLDNPKFVNKFYVKDNYLIYIAEGSTNFMYLKVNDGAKFYVLYINKLADLTVVDNFNLLRKPLESYYMPGEEVEVIIQFLSGPRVGVILNGNKIETTGELVEGLGELFKFTMPNTDSIICITYNDIICNPDIDEHHKWDEGKHQQVPGGGHDELVYTCEYCGHHKYVEFTYEMQMEELATIVENEFKTLNSEKIIIKDLMKMLEDILVEYDLTDTQTKEIEVLVNVLEEIEILESNYVIPPLTEEQQELIDEIKKKLEEVNATLKKDDKMEVDESNYVIPPLTEELQKLIDEINEKLEEVNESLKKDEEKKNDN